MIAKTQLSKRDFQSYLDEYLLQTNEVEINAFWQRMDKVMLKMPEAEKKNFFEFLITGIDESLKDIGEIKQKISILRKNKPHYKKAKQRQG